MNNVVQRINNSALKLLESLSLDETYKTIIEEILQLVKADGGSIVLRNNEEFIRVYKSHNYYSVQLRKRGYAYQAYTTHKPIAISTAALKKSHPELLTIGIKSSVVIPLSYQQKSIGVITLQSKKEKKLSKDDLEALKLFGSMASLAIRKAQLSTEKRQAIESRDEYMTMEQIMEKIHKAGLRFLTPLTIEETYKGIVDEAIKLVGGQHGSILLEKEGSLERVYASHPALYKIIPRKRGYMYSVYKKRKHLILHSKEIKSIHPEIEELETRSDILIPLFNQGKSIGILSVQSKKYNFTEKQLQIIRYFGPLASLAIRKTQLYEEIKKALEIRDLFIALAAHELRTPLTTINGYIQLLYNRLKDKGSIESKWSEQLLWESRRMTYLVSELLEINKIKGGKFQYNLKETSIKMIMERAINNFTFSYPHRSLEYYNQLNNKADLVIADFDKILQVITNLLDNAAKFSPTDKPIKLTLACKNKYFIITVEDKGRGIPKKEHSRVFEEFYKGEGHTEKGMGLGLYLSKDIMNAHHGTISFKSYPGTGTTMILTLPILENVKRRKYATTN